MASITLDHLRQLTDSREKEVEFFFYTNTADKAAQLVAALKELNYSVYEESSGADKNSFPVIGCTTKMKIEDEVFEKWTEQMCALGYKFDCQFDGWGTLAD